MLAYSAKGRASTDSRSPRKSMVAGGHCSQNSGTVGSRVFVIGPLVIVRVSINQVPNNGNGVPCSPFKGSMPKRECEGELLKLGNPSFAYHLLALGGEHATRHITFVAANHILNRCRWQYHV